MLAATARYFSPRPQQHRALRSRYRRQWRAAADAVPALAALYARAALLLAFGCGDDLSVLHLAVRLAGPGRANPGQGEDGATRPTWLEYFSGGQSGAPAVGAGDPVLSAAAGNRCRADPAGLSAKPDVVVTAVRNVDYRHPLGQGAILSGTGAGAVSAWLVPACVCHHL
ncbi:hypothetical protein D3C78_1287860 [compost metagenome]